MLSEPFVRLIDFVEFRQKPGGAFLYLKHNSFLSHSLFSTLHLRFVLQPEGFGAGKSEFRLQPGFKSIDSTKYWTDKV